MPPRSPPPSSRVPEAARDTRRAGLEHPQAHLDQRDDILEAAAALDLIALCHGPGPYDDGATQQEITDPAGEMRSDAATLALLLVAHDRQQPKASRTGLPDLTTGTGLADNRTRDAAREYVRAEWAARQER